jgi:uncharacterized RDD family membrane protein YckC
LHRLGAFLADTAFSLVSIGLGLSLGGWLGDALASPVDDTSARTALFGGLIAALVSWGTNYGFLQGVHGASLGKQLLKLKVLNEDGTPLGIMKSLYRSYTYFASILPFCAGFIAIFFYDKDQCWHDRICHTVVIPKDAAYPAAARTTSSFPYAYSA